MKTCRRAFCFVHFLWFWKCRNLATISHCVSSFGFLSSLCCCYQTSQLISLLFML